MFFKKSNSQISWIVVFLGNPGPKYAMTRHNAGFLAADAFSKIYKADISRLKYRALTGTCEINGEKVLLMKPQTYMNLSGDAVSDAMKFYKVPTERIIVISDDIAQDIGRVRIRKSGSAGGQKGLKSIIEHLKTDTFPRIRIGVGQKPHPEYDLADWVLGRFPKEDEKPLYSVLEQIPSILSLMVKGDFDTAMCNFNGFIGK